MTVSKNFNSTDAKASSKAKLPKKKAYLMKKKD